MEDTQIDSVCVCVGSFLSTIVRYRHVYWFFSSCARLDPLARRVYTPGRGDVLEMLCTTSSLSLSRWPIGIDLLPLIAPWDSKSGGGDATPCRSMLARPSRYFTPDAGGVVDEIPSVFSPSARFIRVSTMFGKKILRGREMPLQSPWRHIYRRRCLWAAHRGAHAGTGRIQLRCCSSSFFTPARSLSIDQ